MKTPTFRSRPFAAASLALLLGLPIYAAAKGEGQGGPGHGRGRHAPSMARMLEKNADRLQLDTNTLTRIQQIDVAQKERSKETRERVKAEHQKLHEMLQADAPSEGAVLAQVDVIGDLRTDLQKERLSSMLQMRALLTPAQRAKLQKLRAEKHEKFMQMRKERRESMKSEPGGAATPLAAPSTNDGSV